ncbi:MAG: endo-1,4-beta-xylanase [Kiritimatiellae bacterium]|jgi:endo-1,4-beta-xylanase|nr:endo-1,4-beta-xylanase [Kiritimatiellia bacterium]
MTKLILIITAFIAVNIFANTNYYQKNKEDLSSAGSFRFINIPDEQETLESLSGSKTIFSVINQDFSLAKSFNVDWDAKIYWDISYKLSSSVPMKKGETIFVTFWAKGAKQPQFVDDGEGAVVQPYIHSDVGNYHKGRVTNFYLKKALTDKWQRFFIKSKPLEIDIPAGQAILKFMVGHKRQHIDIGGIVWMAFEDGYDQDKLPKRDWSYLGQEPNAPWRIDAEKRIDKYRKGDLKITVVDQDGKPVENSEIKVEMQKHAFRFGTAVSVPTFSRKQKNMSEEDILKYREISSKYFNSITIENALKWHLYFTGEDPEGSFSWERTKDCVIFYKKQNIAVRGHVLVWPSYYRTPKELQPIVKSSTNILDKTVNEHIVEKMNLVKGLITDWDVTNETAANRAYMDVLGPQSLVNWYKLAHKTDPVAKLTLNEPKFGTEGMELGSFPKNLLSEKCHGWVDYLIQNDAPLDYLGSQCHGGCVSWNFNGKTGAYGLWEYFDYLFNRYNKKLQYTEVDVRIEDPTDPIQQKYQADMLCDTITMAFAHPAFDAITQWGFWSKRHYAPIAALWDDNWQIRPHGQAYIDLVYKKWWTDKTLKSDSNGYAEIRGFCGEYKIFVVGQEHKQTIKLDNSGTNITIRIMD